MEKENIQELGNETLKNVTGGFAPSEKEEPDGEKNQALSDRFGHEIGDSTSEDQAPVIW